MGVEYLIACKDCKVTRDLDKFYTACFSASSRNDIFEMEAKIKNGWFRCALLVTFMGDHIGHNVVMFCENMDIEEELDPYHSDEYKKDYDFWQQEDK